MKCASVQIIYCFEIIIIIIILKTHGKNPARLY